MNVTPELTALRRQLSANESDISTNTSNIDQNTQNVTANQGEVTAVDGEITDVQQLRTGVDGQLSALQASLNGVEDDAERVAVEGSIRDLEAQITNFNNQERNFNNQRTDLVRTGDDLARTGGELKTDGVRLNREHTEIQGNIIAAENEIANSPDENNNVQTAEEKVSKKNTEEKPEVSNNGDANQPTQPSENSKKPVKSGERPVDLGSVFSNTSTILDLGETLAEKGGKMLPPEVGVASKMFSVAGVAVTGVQSFTDAAYHPERLNDEALTQITGSAYAGAAQKTICSGVDAVLSTTGAGTVFAVACGTDNLVNEAYEQSERESNAANKAAKAFADGDLGTLAAYGLQQGFKVIDTPTMRSLRGGVERRVEEYIGLIDKDAAEYLHKQYSKFEWALTDPEALANGVSKGAKKAINIAKQTYKTTVESATVIVNKIADKTKNTANKVKPIAKKVITRGESYLKSGAKAILPECTHSTAGKAYRGAKNFIKGVFS